ncbi:MAG: L-lactate dehydrogenase complex protein LldG [Nocardioidaceae bacterium]|nr:L-lactate dehydrogenase complex protein LldG [Nocardioidaceae bacterium]
MTAPSAREQILADVRRALAHADTSPVTVPRGYRDTSSVAAGSDAAVVDLFAERVADYRAEVVRCALDDVAARIAEALPPEARVVVPDGLPWAVVGSLSDDGLSAMDLDHVDAVVTGASVGIATTGTIVLSHGAGQGRRALTLVPDLHVCVVRADQVVADVPDAFALLDPARPTTWISGPSATSDIELDRVEGVHGPRHLHVIVAG